MKKRSHQNELSAADMERAQRAVALMEDEEIFRPASLPPSRVPLSPEMLRAKRLRYRRNVAARQASTLPAMPSEHTGQGQDIAL